VGHPNEAAAEFEAAVHFDPAYAEAHDNLQELVHREFCNRSADFGTMDGVRHLDSTAAAAVAWALRTLTDLDGRIKHDVLPLFVDLIMVVRIRGEHGRSAAR
jgi:hypothetical protein